MASRAIQSVVSVWGCRLAVGLLGGHPVLAQEKAAPRISVTVDPRVELLSIIFRLAGNPEYSQGRVPSYVKDVDSQFGPFRDHAVVTLAKKLRQTRGVSYDAVMGMAVHVTDAVSLQERTSFSPQPKSLDARWTPESAREFLALTRKVFTMPVALEPGTEYVFGLNAEPYLGFRSEEGIPLAPVRVRFKTRQADK